MKGKKEFAILFFIIAVLVFYIYSEKGEKTHYELPEITRIDADDISKITITKSGEEITLVRENDKWFAGEQKYPADSTVIDNMVGNIAGLKLTALASESKSYSIYELDKDKRIEVEGYKGDELLRKIIIGKPAASYRHTFVMLDDDHRVFHAEGNIKNSFDKKVSDLRDRTVMRFSDDITDLVIKKGDEEIKIARASAPVSVDITGEEGEARKTQEAGPKWTTADGRPVKESEIDGIINTLSSFQCDEFLEDETKDDFKSPIYTAALAGVNTYTISIFEKTGDKYPAVSSESPYPFLIAEWKANKIMKEPESLINLPGSK